MISQADLMLNEDGSIYHLNLHPGEIADTIILVGDPDRVSQVSNFFDRIEVRKQKREFITHTGYFKGKRLSVISTGIGIGNIDIVLNELDALANVDFATRQTKPQISTLQFIRFGTCGGLSEKADVDSIAVSQFGLAFDSLLAYYPYQASHQEKLLTQAAKEHFASLATVRNAYAVKGDPSLVEKFSVGTVVGVTLTCVGFYAPQGRQLRIASKGSNILDLAQQFNFHGARVVNFEMETAAIYGLAGVMGHKACSISVVLANRLKKTVSQQPKQSVLNMIEWALEQLVQS